MNHPLLKSRVGGFMDEGGNVNFFEWSESRHSEEHPASRLKKAYYEDTMRQLGTMAKWTANGPVVPKIKAMSQNLLRFAAFGSHVGLLFGGATHAPREYNTALYSGGADTLRDHLEYHLKVLDALGTLVYHPGFAYAPDLEAKADVDLESRKAVQSQIVGSLRVKYPELAIVLTPQNYGNPEDAIEYGAMPAEGTILRWCNYIPFPSTHSLDRGFTGGVPYPITAKDVAALRAKYGAAIEEWKYEEVEKCIGYGRAQMRALFARVKATGNPLLCQESGYDRLGGNDESATRWHSDSEACFYALGMARLRFSAGVLGGSGGRWGLGVGLSGATAHQSGRTVAGLG